MANKRKTLKIEVKNSKSTSVYNVSSKESFSIGYKPNNSIQIFGHQVPPTFEMLRGKGEKFALKVQDSMSGEITTDNCPLSISDLIKHRLLRWDKDGYVIELSEDKKAEIKFKDYDFQIKYEDGPLKAEQIKPYWKLSRRIYRRLTSDLLFKFVLLILLTFGGYVSYRIHIMPVVKERKVNLKKFTRHVARIVIKPDKPKNNFVESKKGTKGNQQSQESKPEDKVEESAEPNAASEKPADASAERTVPQKGLVGLIVGRGASNEEGTVIESLVDQGLVRELDEVIKSSQDLELELPSMTDVGGDLENLLADSETQVDELISGTEINDQVELKEKGDVNLESFGELQGSEEALGWRSEQSIRDVINAYMGKVTYTYNKYLKLNPDMKGKVVLEITIDASGKVTKCFIVSSTVNNEKFEEDLKEVVMSFSFEPIPEGEITVQNPFLFYRRDM